ncbi:Cerato-platanin-domain-containing protein [Ramaria rubella]|nr:Cerato-platanin-domain-containing protein [Ramaria rubella]
MYFVWTLAASSFIESVSYDNPMITGETVFPSQHVAMGSTFDSLPAFPNIGGVQVIAGWDSTNCGTCWSLTYEGKSINLIAIDTTFTGFNIAKVLDDLTDGHAVELGRVNVTAMQFPASLWLVSCVNHFVLLRRR